MPTDTISGGIAIMTTCTIKDRFRGAIGTPRSLKTDSIILDDICNSIHIESLFFLNT
jgi:hypothetical protein